jgi:hypothetical protein
MLNCANPQPYTDAFRSSHLSGAYGRATLGRSLLQQFVIDQLHANQTAWKLAIQRRAV